MQQINFDITPPTIISNWMVEVSHGKITCSRWWWSWLNPFLWLEYTEPLPLKKSSTLSIANMLLIKTNHLNHQHYPTLSIKPNNAQHDQREMVMSTQKLRDRRNEIFLIKEFQTLQPWNSERMMWPTLKSCYRLW